MSAICCYTMSCLILWDGCQEFSLYRRDLCLTSQEGRNAAEEASSKLWRQKRTPLGASIRLITQEQLGKQHWHTLTHIPKCTYISQMGDWEYNEKYLQHVGPPIADGQLIESLSKNQQLHSDVQCYGPPDNYVYFPGEREEERIKIGAGLEWQVFHHICSWRAGWIGCYWSSRSNDDTVTHLTLRTTVD